MYLSKEQRQNEIVRMRVELMYALYERLAESRINQLRSYSETVMDALKNGVTLEHSYIERAKEKMSQETDASIQELHQISSMSDDEVRRVYYDIFKRRHPAK